MASQRGKEVHFLGHKLYNEFISRSSANFVLPPLFFPVAWNHGERTYFKKYNIFDWHHEGSARARKMGWHISLFSFLRPTLLKAVWAHILIPSLTRHRRGNVNEGDLFSLAALCPSLLWHFQVLIKKKAHWRTLLWSAVSRLLSGYTIFKSKQIVMNELQYHGLPMCDHLMCLNQERSSFHQAFIGSGVFHKTVLRSDNWWKSEPEIFTPIVLG